MKTINKIVLTMAISKELSIKAEIVKQVVDSLFEQIRKEYKKGNRIELRKFGTFTPYLRQSRIYKTFDTGEVKQMPTKKMLKFKCSKHLHI
jgi:nucleoid DNA-binding protein